MGGGSSNFDPLEGVAILIAANAFSRTIAKQGNLSHQPFWPPKSPDSTDLSTFVDNVLSDTLGVFTSIAHKLPQVHDRIEKGIRDSPSTVAVEFGLTARQVAGDAKAFLNPDVESFPYFEKYLEEKIFKGVRTFQPSLDSAGMSRDIGKNEKVRLFKLPSLHSSFRLTNALQGMIADVEYAINGVHCVEQHLISEKYLRGRASEPEIMLFAMFSREHAVINNTKLLLAHAVSQVPPFGRKKAFA